ncbi:MAG: N-acetylmuramoyl-L-alanine amidase [Clostridiales bacterium]|nr:N-acetylmuramoyl-L-alanine amidase [Clostridiales bacterium]
MASRSHKKRPSRRPYEVSDKELRRNRKRIQNLFSLLLIVAFIVIVILLLKAIMHGRADRTSSEGPSLHERLKAALKFAEGPPPEPPDTFEGLLDINQDTMVIDQYFTYGTHLYFSGSYNTLPQVVQAEAVVRPINEALDVGAWTMWLETDEEDGGVTHFCAADGITTGPDLDQIPAGKYALLMKLTAANGDVQYRFIKDESHNQPFDYYTVTRNGSNRKIQMKTMTDTVHGFTFFGIEVEETELPEDIYDFVIDPGHGGTDEGCLSRDEKVKEADLVLEIGLKTKELLEAHGYKVLMTRDGTEDPSEEMAYTMYAENGRVNKACRSRAKMGLSIHIDESSYDSERGFSVTGTIRDDWSFNLPKKLVSSIRNHTKAVFWDEEVGNVKDGIYYGAYDGFMVDGTFNNRDAFYMIRELGGVATGAMYDGNYEYYVGENQFRNSLQGVECDLVTLGFMTNDDDLKDIMGNKDTYAEALAEALDSMIRDAPILSLETAPKAIPSAQARQAEKEANGESTESTEPDK